MVEIFLGVFIKPTLASSSLFTIRLTSNEFLPEYVAIYLNSEVAQYYFSQSAKGATIQSLLIDDLRNLSIAQVPLDNQQTIVNMQKNIEAQNQILTKKQKIIDEVLRSSVNQILEGATKWP